MSKVHVVLNRKGELIHQNENNSEYGYFLVKGEEGLVTFGSNGFANAQRARQCLVAAPWSLLEKAVETGMVLGNGQTAVLAEGVEIPGKIVIRESINQGDLYDTTKVDENVGLKFRSGAHREAMMPYASGDQPIYQKKFFTEDLNAADVLVQATNIADVNEFSQEQIAKGNKNLLADFKPAKVGAKK